MKIQNRLISLVILLSIVFVGGRHAYQIFENRRIYLFFKEDNKEKKFFFDKVIELKEAGLATLAFDYTYWDEMVDFVHKKNMRWAEQNINATTLKTYQADAIWVYRTDLSLVYSVTDEDAVGLKQLPFSSEEIRNLFFRKTPGAFFHQYAFRSA